MNAPASHPKGPRALLRSPWVLAILAGVALGIVIFVVSALSTSGRTPAVPSAVPDATTALDSLVSRAQIAASTGDTATAVRLAQQVLSKDPGNPAAKRLIDTVTKPQPHTPNPPTPGAGGFDKPVKDLTKLLPVSIDGMVRGMYQTTASDVQVPFSPRVDSPVFHGVLFSAHDQGTSTNARLFVERVVKVAFASEGSLLSVAGVPAYFGRNGQVGEIGFVRGRYAFEVAVSGGSATTGQLTSMAVSLASRVPTHTP